MIRKLITLLLITIIHSSVHLAFAQEYTPHLRQQNLQVITQSEAKSLMRTGNRRYMQRTAFI